MNTHAYGAARFGQTKLAAGDRVRVATGVFGSPARVRSISAGHILVHYDCGGREVIDPTRRAVWLIGRAAAP